MHGVPTGPGAGSGGVNVVLPPRKQQLTVSLPGGMVVVDHVQHSSTSPAGATTDSGKVSPSAPRILPPQTTAPTSSEEESPPRSIKEGFFGAEHIDDKLPFNNKRDVCFLFVFILLKSKVLF